MLFFDNDHLKAALFSEMYKKIERNQYMNTDTIFRRSIVIHRSSFLVVFDVEYYRKLHRFECDTSNKYVGRQIKSKTDRERVSDIGT